MKLVSLVLFAAIVATGCTSSQREEIRVALRIQGGWTVDHPATQCEERYTFDDNNKFTYKSLTRESRGTYKYPVNNFVDSATNNMKTYQLDLTYTVSNGEADCNGVSKVDSGTETVYVQHFGHTNMVWLDKPDSGQKLKTMNKK